VTLADQDIILFEDPAACIIELWDRSIEGFEMILETGDFSGGLWQRLDGEGAETTSGS
jgi:hypothetical protein